MLVPRLYDVTAGAVRVDGHDVRDLTQDSLHAAIGAVTQDPHLFHDTVGNNLRYARPDATDDELVAAARAAQIHDVIAALPDGYDTLVGERGYRLSGGEKQRLAIARMLLKDPTVVILDEATSQLDSENEAAIQRALAEALAGRTSVVIAHRLSTITTADQILVLDGGRIVERGRHADLLAAGGLYADLYRTLVRSDLAGPGPVARRRRRHPPRPGLTHPGPVTGCSAQSVARQWVPSDRGRGNRFRMRNPCLILPRVEPIASPRDRGATGPGPAWPGLTRSGLAPAGSAQAAHAVRRGRLTPRRGNGFHRIEVEAIGSGSGTSCLILPRAEPIASPRERARRDRSARDGPPGGGTAGQSPTCDLRKAMSSLRPSSAVSQIDRRARGLDDRHQQVGIDRSGAEVGVAVAARAGLVLRVVAVDQVDAARDALDALDRVDQGLAGRPGVARVEAEADAGVADVVPQPADRVEVAGHGVVAAGGVLEEDRHLGLDRVDALAPALEARRRGRRPW